MLSFLEASTLFTDVKTEDYMAETARAVQCEPALGGHWPSASWSRSILALHLVPPDTCHRRLTGRQIWDTAAVLGDTRPVGSSDMQ